VLQQTAAMRQRMDAADDRRDNASLLSGHKTSLQTPTLRVCLEPPIPINYPILSIKFPTSLVYSRANPSSSEVNKSLSYYKDSEAEEEKRMKSLFIRLVPGLTSFAVEVADAESDA
jgi:hypothetical protein